MNAGALSERDQRVLAKALEAKKINALEICRAIHGFGSHRPMRFGELARMLRKSLQPTVRDLTIVRMAIGMAESGGFIREAEPTVFDKTDFGGYFLTDAGRHILKTAVTGPKAYSILDEIEAEEMAECACPNLEEPRGCWRVRCQLGRTCVEPSRGGEA